MGVVGAHPLVWIIVKQHVQEVVLAELKARAVQTVRMHVHRVVPNTAVQTARDLLPHLPVRIAQAVVPPPACQPVPILVRHRHHKGVLTAHRVAAVVAAVTVLQVVAVAVQVVVLATVAVVVAVVVQVIVLATVAVAVAVVAQVVAILHVKDLVIQDVLTTALASVTRRVHQVVEVVATLHVEELVMAHVLALVLGNVHIAANRDVQAHVMAHANQHAPRHVALSVIQLVSLMEHLKSNQ